VTKTYRLINVKSTTPEELYAHKVRICFSLCSSKLVLINVILIRDILINVEIRKLVEISSNLCRNMYKIIQSM